MLVYLKIQRRCQTRAYQRLLPSAFPHGRRCTQPRAPPCRHSKRSNSRTHSARLTAHTTGAAARAKEVETTQRVRVAPNHPRTFGSSTLSRRGNDQIKTFVRRGEKRNKNCVTARAIKLELTETSDNTISRLTCDSSYEECPNRRILPQFLPKSCTL